MDKLREKIKYYDKEIIKLLGKRFKVIEEIARYKADNKINIRDKNQEKKVLVRIKEHAKDYGINPMMAYKIYKLILKESRAFQKEIIKSLRP